MTAQYFLELFGDQLLHSAQIYAFRSGRGYIRDEPSTGFPGSSQQPGSLRDERSQGYVLET